MINSVILAGGFGSRISEETLNKPKPLISIGQKPIIWFIMRHFSKFGIKNFKIAGGYKVDMIKEYFMNFNIANNDFEINYNNNKIKYSKKIFSDWKVGVYNTGLTNQTGSRIQKMKKILNLKKNDFFLMTYGDGLCDININDLIKFHKKHKKIATVTAVRPPARFGYMKIKGDMVKYFKEKSRSDEGWINGGYFVIEPSFLKFIRNDRTYLEREPLEIITKKKKLGAYKHRDFWQCVDTLRDVKNLEINLKNIKYKNLFD